MTNFNDFPFKGPGLTIAAQVEVIWSMGCASLSSNKYHIVVPMTMAQAVGNEGVGALKSRLSQFLNASVTTFVDVQTNTMHICRTSDHPTTIAPPVSTQGYGQPSVSCTSSPSTMSSLTDELDQPDQKFKVPRPPNAFILYRKHFHPILKFKHPELHNNDISVILGKQWNGETDEVKNDYRGRAEKIKKKHAIDNPGYQYAPRKTSEKKRRMTARKFAQLKASDEINSPSSHGTPSTQTTTPSEKLLPGIEQSLFNSVSDGQVSVAMPEPSYSFQQQLWQQSLSTLPGTMVPFDDELQRGQISTEPSAPNVDEQAFMNSVIDWEGIRSDSQLVFGADSQEMQAMDNVETGEFYATFNAMTDTEFEAELERLTKML